ncbi:MAG: fimbrillin family protein [Prevotella sp.]|nr:fimbrillin family protein [Prevotella sp.]MDD6866926.1 fimbrillin family protein [Prevotella sp.]
MKKFLFFPVAALAATISVATLSSCSNDDDIAQGGLPSAQNEMKFTVTTSKSATRALPITSSNYLTQMKGFKVWANYSSSATGTGVVPGALYMGYSQKEGISISGNGSGGWYYLSETDKYYWPATTAPLNFYAITPRKDDSIELVNNNLSELPVEMAKVTVPTENNKQVDVMIASALNQTSATNNKTVALQFKHALSQIVFQGILSSDKIRVEIGGLTIKNIANAGVIGFKAGTQEIGVTADKTNVADYSIGLSNQTMVSSTSRLSEFTAEDGALIIMPQTLTGWTTTSSVPVTTAQADSKKQTYLSISCKIKSGDTYLVGSSTAFGNVYVPFSASFLPGKKYVYTLIFGENASSSGQSQGAFDANGNPILQTIQFSANVQDWSVISGNTPL